LLDGALENLRLVVGGVGAQPERTGIKLRPKCSVARWRGARFAGNAERAGAG
jgi:hypothetical protein